MKYSDLLKKFNLGIIVKSGKVREEVDRVQERREMLASYTGTFDIDADVTVGIKPISQVADGFLRITWEVSAIRDHNGSLMRIPFEHMTQAEMDAVYEIRGLVESIEAQDKDIEETLEQRGFRAYTREDTA